VFHILLSKEGDEVAASIWRRDVDRRDVDEVLGYEVRGLAYSYDNGRYNRLHDTKVVQSHQ
jgi:hypothetical protein